MIWRALIYPCASMALFTRSISIEVYSCTNMFLNLTTLFMNSASSDLIIPLIFSSSMHLIGVSEDMPVIAHVCRR
jgi:hypothetical protein